jgi:hypothetical protein
MVASKADSSNAAGFLIKTTISKTQFKTDKQWQKRALRGTNPT